MSTEKGRGKKGITEKAGGRKVSTEKGRGKKGITEKAGGRKVNNQPDT